VKIQSILEEITVNIANIVRTKTNRIGIVVGIYEHFILVRYLRYTECFPETELTKLNIPEYPLTRWGDNVTELDMININSYLICHGIKIK
jgi:hypothetical protein